MIWWESGPTSRDNESMSGQAKSKLKHAEMQVVVTRADGTVEDHGVVASYDAPTSLLGRILEKFKGVTAK